MWRFNTVFKVSTARNNIVPVKGTVEFGRDVLAIPVTIVVGHSDCGAIKAAMAGTQSLDPDIKKEIDLLQIDPSKILNENTVNNVHRQIALAMEDVQDNVMRVFIGVIYDHQCFW